MGGRVASHLEAQPSRAHGAVGLAAVVEEGGVEVQPAPEEVNFAAERGARSCALVVALAAALAVALAAALARRARRPKDAEAVGVDARCKRMQRRVARRRNALASRDAAFAAVAVTAAC